MSLPAAHPLGFEVDLVEVRAPLPLSGDLHKSLSLQLLDVRVDALAGDSDVIGQPVLSWKTVVVVPSIGKQHSVGEFGVMSHGEV